MEIRFPSIDKELAAFDTAVAAVNRFHWNLSVERLDADSHHLFAGEVLLGVFASQDELGDFVAGMAASLVVLPEEIVQAIDEYVGV